MRSARLIAIALATTLIAIHPVRAGERESLEQVSKHFDDLQFRRDRPALEALVSSDLVYVNGRGQRAGRDAFLDAVLAPVATLEPFEIEERQIHPLGDGAGAVTGLATVKGTGTDGKPFEVTFRYVDVFTRVDGRWRVALVQVTPVPAP